MAVEKLKYAAAAAFTFTSLASLASSDGRLAGAESTAIDNGTNLYLDALVSGTIKIGSGVTLTTGLPNPRIDINIYAAHDETPTYQAPFDGTDSAETLLSAGHRAQVVLLKSIIITDPTQLIYHLAQTSVAAKFGGVLPRFWGLFVSHDTGQPFDASGHGFKYTGIHRETV